MVQVLQQRTRREQRPTTFSGICEPVHGERHTPKNKPPSRRSNRNVLRVRGKKALL